MFDWFLNKVDPIRVDLIELGIVPTSDMDENTVLMVRNIIAKENEEIRKSGLSRNDLYKTINGLSIKDRRDLLKDARDFNKSKLDILKVAYQEKKKELDKIEDALESNFIALKSTSYDDLMIKINMMITTHGFSRINETKEIVDNTTEVVTFYQQMERI